MSLENAQRTMVADLSKPANEIKDSMDPEKWGLLMQTMSRCIDAGTSLDDAKKIIIYGKDNDQFEVLLQAVPDLPENMYHLIHMVIGIVGEASELLEAIRLAILTNRMDIDNVIEEMGDIEFYMEGFRQGLCVNRDTTIEQNIQKLLTGEKARYAKGTYSNEAAQNRADKK